MASTRRRKLSLFGSLSLAAALVAFVAMYVPIGGVGAITIGLGGALFGVLGLLMAMLSGGTGRVLPLLGLLASVAAVGLAVRGGERTDWVAARVIDIVARYRGGQPPATPATPERRGSAGEQPSVSGSRSGSGTDRIGKGTIFDETTPGTPDAGGSRPDRRVPSGSLVPPHQERSSAAAPSPSANVGAAVASLQAARTKLDASIKPLLPALARTPAYQNAKAAADTAEADLKQARATSEPGSPELINASRRWVDARSALQRLIDAAVAADPTAGAAKREVAQAEANLAAEQARLSRHANPVGAH